VINFRYHVVSLTAVFLSLAIGLVVGTAAGNGPAVDSLRGQIATISEEKDQLRGTVRELTEEVNRQEEAWDEVAEATLPGKLSGKRVLVLSFGSSSKYVDGVCELLGTAGANVTGRLKLEDKFTDPTSNEELLDLALQAAPSGVRGALPSNSNGVETSTALLAAVLVAGAPVEGSRTVLGAYQGFVAVTGDPTPAEAVVMLTGPPYTGSDATKRNAAVVTIAERFDRAGRIVVAAPAASGEGNAIRAVRNTSELAKNVSTVDNVSTALGRLGTVLALIEQFEGRAGHYGIGAGSTATMPNLGEHSGA
jgi:hypothetical protein